MKRKTKIHFTEVVLAAILAIYAVSIVYLIFWALLTSLKTNDDFLIGQNFFNMPKEWDNFENYKAVFKHLYVRVNRDGVMLEVDVFWQTVYTLAYAGVGCVLSAGAPLIAAYASSRYDFKFNEVLSYVVLVTMIIPIVGSEISMLSLMHTLNLYDSFFGIYCQKFIFTGIYFLIYKGILSGVSKAYSEAATLDGASELQIMVKINLPLVVNVFATVALIFFINYWNDYQTPLLYLPSHPTLAYGIYFLTQNTVGELNITPRKMSGCMLLIIPITILFILFKDKLMSNLSMGGVKE